MVSDADILELIKTVPEAKQLLKDVTAAIDALFSHVSVIQTFDECIAFDKKTKIIALMNMHRINTNDISQIQQFLQQLVTRAQEMPVIGITLAFEPKQQLVTSLSAWFVVHAHKAVLLDVQVDKTLIGGAIIAANGVYKDFSVKRILRERYKNAEISLEFRS